MKLGSVIEYIDKQRILCAVVLEVKSRTYSVTFTDNPGDVRGVDKALVKAPLRVIQGGRKS